MLLQSAALQLKQSFYSAKVFFLSVGDENRWHLIPWARHSKNIPHFLVSCIVDFGVRSPILVFLFYGISSCLTKLHEIPLLPLIITTNQITSNTGQFIRGKWYISIDLTQFTHDFQGLDIIHQPFIELLDLCRTRPPDSW